MNATTTPANQDAPPKPDSEATLAAPSGSATLPDWHRLSIRYDGTEIMGVTVTCKRPENHEQMTALIRELLDFMTAPTVPDMEVLGDKSPNAPDERSGGQ